MLRPALVGLALPALNRRSFRVALGWAVFLRRRRFAFLFAPLALFVLVFLEVCCGSCSVLWLAFVFVFFLCFCAGGPLAVCWGWGVLWGVGWRRCPCGAVCSGRGWGLFFARVCGLWCFWCWGWVLFVCLFCPGGCFCWCSCRLARGWSAFGPVAFSSGCSFGFCGVSGGWGRGFLPWGCSGSWVVSRGLLACFAGVSDLVVFPFSCACSWPGWFLASFVLLWVVLFSVFSRSAFFRFLVFLSFRMVFPWLNLLHHNFNNRSMVQSKSSLSCWMRLNFQRKSKPIWTRSPNFTITAHATKCLFIMHFPPLRALPAFAHGETNSIGP